MRILCRLKSIVLLAVALYAASARADDPDAPVFSFSGFGTVGAIHSSERNADFIPSVFKPGGAGYSGPWNTDADSLIAAQVTANFTPRLSAVLQVISELNNDNTYRPHMEWGNIKYQFTPDISVRIGRTVLPAFMYSDNRKVGYTYPWVRPPLEVYDALPVTANDGLDASYRVRFGDLTNTIQVDAGEKNTDDVNNRATYAARGGRGIVNTAEYGPLTAHVVYREAVVTAEALNSLFNGFRQFGPQGVAIANKYDFNKKPMDLVSVGASYDPGNWFVASEWVRARYNSAIGKRIAWYASGGYRSGKFTTYVTYAKAKADNLSDPGLNVSALPPFLTGPALELNAVLNSILRTKPVQNTISIGTRWDFMKNTALKLQFDHTRVSAGSVGMATNIQPNFQTGGKVNLFSATIDFVF